MSDLCPIAASISEMNLEDQPVGGSLLGLLKSKKFCDVIFTFPNLPDRIDAHEFCLKACSPVFEQIFRLRKSGNVQGNEIQICEFTPELFQQFLEFIYSDRVDVDIAGALDLLQLSQKYQVQPLTQRCEQLLLTEIPTLDSVKVFEAARRHGRLELMGRAGQIMIKSFLELVETDALANAEEETLVYLLESDDLAVKEVGLFQFILVWGKNQVGIAADEELLRNKLKNLICKIRYTNMAPDEFTKVVVPTGLLSAEEDVSVYSYLCVDEVTRRSLKTKFNTTRRKGETNKMVTKIVDFFANQSLERKSFYAFSQHCMRYREQYVLNFNVLIGESSGPVEEGTFTIRFMTKLSNCKQDDLEKVSVDPPVELVTGRAYSVIVENHSPSGSNNSFLCVNNLYEMLTLNNMNGEANVDFEDVSLTLRDILRKKGFYAKYACEFALIQRIEIGLI